MSCQVLDTVGPCGFSGILPGGLAAHAKSAPGTGELDHLVLNGPIDLARISW
jgi:carotenoid cleavage dioxygenase-like enzyme